MIDIVQADVLRWAKGYDGPKFHAALMDPPYEIAFMSRSWDNTGIAFRPETWAALGEHLLPGAFCMAFASSRGYHRMACAIEDAGFRIFPMMLWVTGSSFPKASRIDTAIDRAAGAERPLGEAHRCGFLCANTTRKDKSNVHMESIEEAGKWRRDTLPATDLARIWAGHRYGGQALKDAATPICVFQKPYAGRPVDSITEYGAGALWIDGARIGTNGDISNARADKSGGCEFFMHGDKRGATEWNGAAGRWPSNLILQHAPGCKRVGVKRVQAITGGTGETTQSIGGRGAYQGGDNRGFFNYADADGLETVEAWECVEGCAAAALGEQSGERGGGKFTIAARQRKASWRKLEGRDDLPSDDGLAIDNYGDTGTAARFFQQCDWALEVQEAIEAAEPFSYNAKASRRERDAGLEGMPLQATQCAVGMDKVTVKNWGDPEQKVYDRHTVAHNVHPTVKPIALARYLATLLLPPAEYAPRRILVPFSGVASECIGAHLAGWEDVLGIEAEAEYCDLARARIAHWCKESLPLFAYAEAAS
jgi:hypothetical protein